MNKFNTTTNDPIIQDLIRGWKKARAKMDIATERERLEANLGLGSAEWDKAMQAMADALHEFHTASVQLSTSVVFAVEKGTKR